MIQVDIRILKELLHLADVLPEPKDYFNGQRCSWSCHIDNVLLFLRRSRTTLQQETFESRQHHRFVLVINLEGKGVISIDRSYIRLAPGEAILVLPFQFHHYLNLNQERLRWLFLTFESSTPEALEAFRFQTLPLGPEAHQRIERILKLSLEKIKLRRSNLLIADIHSLLCLLKSVLKPASFGKTLSLPQDSHPLAVKILNQINNYLKDNQKSPCSIRDLAQRCSLSESRLRFWFSHYFGLSLGSYIRKYKIHQAIACMQQAHTSLYQVADLCGYTSLATFSRSFKMQTGHTPSEFRQKHLSARVPNS